MDRRKSVSISCTDSLLLAFSDLKILSRHVIMVSSVTRNVTSSSVAFYSPRAPRDWISSLLQQRHTRTSALKKRLTEYTEEEGGERQQQSIILHVYCKRFLCLRFPALFFSATVCLKPASQMLSVCAHFLSFFFLVLMFLFNFSSSSQCLTFPHSF